MNENKLKIVSGLYGVLLDIEEEYKKIENPKVSFDIYSKEIIKKLTEKALEWLVDNSLMNSQDDE